MTGLPKAYNEIIVLAPTPYFLERGSFPFGDDIGEYKKLRIRNGFWRRNSIIVEKGGVKNPSELSRELADMGYERRGGFAIGEIHRGEYFPQGGL
ncbi:MAG: hypothetical protein AAB846_02425, partial [Patescibacteria group bacterium]